MPKVLSYAPPWLCKPSLGSKFFDRSSGTGGPSRSRQHEKSSRDSYHGPRRTIARRGTEIFAVVGREIRWTDLIPLKEQWEQQERSRHGHHARKRQEDEAARSQLHEGEEDGDGSSETRPYRTFKVPVTKDIKQLSISPNGSYMAIITSHTAHIAFLPDSSHLRDQDTEPLRLKTFQLGPTAHVVENASIVSALWHPLGVLGTCLITVTTDAVVRLWEIDKANRWSFDNPTLAIDLKKLANGTSAQEDFSASKYGANKGYSPDSFEMEVAAAAFGGCGSEEEHGWAGMTLWIAMKEGDVYALCPLLPSKWCPPSTLIPSLSTAVVSKAAAIEARQDATDEERRQCRQQYQWFSEIDCQEPLVVSTASPFQEVQVYSRPSAPGPIPRLQGPFQMDPDVEDDIDVTDIHVVAAKLDDEELMAGEDIDWIGEEVGLSAGVVCLMTRSGRVYVCLDLEETEGLWLPSKRSKSLPLLDGPQPSLVLYEVLELFDANQQPSKPQFPMFSTDPHSRYSIFVTHCSGLSYLSFDSWVQLLEGELQSNSDTGGEFRLDILLSSTTTLIEELIRFPRLNNDTEHATPPSCVAIQDPDLVYLVLTTVSDQPFAAVLDSPSSIADADPPDNRQLAITHPVTTAPRQPYQGHPIFHQPSALPTLFRDDNVQASGRVLRSMREEIKFSPATLQIMTEVHRVLSLETDRLGAAAADLFRRCERLREELKQQVRKVAQANVRVEALVSDDEDVASEDGEGAQGDGGPDTKVERRINKVNERQRELVTRYEALRRKVPRLGGRDMSNQEKAWAAEVDKMRQAVLDSSEDTQTENGKTTETGKVMSQRFQAVRSLKDELIQQIPGVDKQQRNGEDGNKAEGQVEKRKQDALGGLRKEKMEQVLALLERETALVDATRGRLERLTVE